MQQAGDARHTVLRMLHGMWWQRQKANAYKRAFSSILIQM
jgi:hypothetical protein